MSQTRRPSIGLHGRFQLGGMVGSPRRSKPNRSSSGSRFAVGFSLLEVILALAILAGALAILTEVARMAMHNAGRARDLAQAQLLCEGKLAEILAGIEPAEPVSAVPFDTGQVPDWLYSVEVASLDVDGLIEVRVTVEQDLPPERRPVRWTLVRWMVDPATGAEVDLVAQAEASAQGSQVLGTSGGTETATSREAGETGGASRSPASGGSGGQQSGTVPSGTLSPSGSTQSGGRLSPGGGSPESEFPSGSWPGEERRVPTPPAQDAPATRR